MRRSARLILFSAALPVVLCGPAVPAFASPASHLALTSVSNPRPDLVSGGNVLVRVTGADARPSFDVDGRHRFVTAHPEPDGSYLALVGGLSIGRHRITAVVGHHRADLRVRDFSINGPVFSGPQQAPFICETSAFGLAPATQPTAPLQRRCPTSTRTPPARSYRWPIPRRRPADLATAQVDGRAVPYIVRLEQGTIDRAVFQVAALYDGTDRHRGRRISSWNRRLVYTFGGGCDAGFHQGNTTGGVINDLFLAQGYAVASSTLNVLDNNCSTIISAEAAMMVKEHFIEEYGPVAHTIGWGGSGGAIQQYDIADAYPGILDGIVPGVSFPDPFTTLGPVTDCRLLDNYFARRWQRLHRRPAARGGRLHVVRHLPVLGCDVRQPNHRHRQLRPGRSRSACSGTPSPIPTASSVRPPSSTSTSSASTHTTGFARSVLDNVGVQYGLTALRKGEITPSSSPISTQRSAATTTPVSRCRSVVRRTAGRSPRRTGTIWSTAPAKAWPTPR